MDIETFWNTIDRTREVGGSDPDARIDALRDELAPLPPVELQAFQNHYDRLSGSAYRWDIWGAAYVMLGGCSDDGFHYFRDWLISEGRTTFEAALADPDSLADLPRIDVAENESYGYVALELFEKAESGELDRDMSTEGTEPLGERWDEDKVYGMFPRLSALYG